MGRAKEITLKVIPARVAVPFVKRHHYSGKVCANSQLHFGAFLDGTLHGVLSFGPSMDKSNLVGLVEGTGWNEFIELNRMAFDDILPRNSESRCIGQALRIIRRQAPHIKWVISFADGTQCGDGTIYRAANFVLTGIKENSGVLEFPDGERVCRLTLSSCPTGETARRQSEKLGVPLRYRAISEWTALGARPLPGFMLRYIYFLDKTARARLTVPEIPFSEIDRLGAGMCKGEQVTRAERHARKTEHGDKE